MTSAEKLLIAREALQWSYEMFLNRDIMNSRVHCAPLVLSPITERTKLAISAIDSISPPQDSVIDSV